MKEWRILPPQWRKMTLDDRAQVLAYELFTNTREAYRQDWKDQKRKEKDKWVNPYESMKRQMGIE